MQIKAALPMGFAVAPLPVQLQKPWSFVIKIQIPYQLFNRTFVLSLQFSVSQYSTGFNIHSSFNQFHTYQGWESQIRSIEQIGSGTNTAAAIRKVV